MLFRFFISLKTTVWLLCLVIAALLAGAFIMPGKAEFQTVHSEPLIKWLQAQSPGITWWLWAAIGLLVVLTANTLFCSVESVLKKRKAAQWLLIISPQIIHLGFLFILLAHLFSSTGAFKGHVAVTEGTLLDLGGSSLRVKQIDIALDQYGYIRDWSVTVDYLANGAIVQEERILPNQPSVREGLGVYVKDLRAYPEKAVLLELSREPGAVWALTGGILFMVGIIMLVLLKMKRERQD